jgi:hypothetical protein
MAVVSVTDNSGLASVRVTWATPTENGSTVSAYEIKLLSSTAGVYYEITAECDGSTAATVANLYCDILQTTLQASPFGLAAGDAIVAIARARNAVGWSATYSSASAGAVYIQGAPAAPASAPTVSSQSISSLTVEMPLIAESQTGGSAITSYNLQYDQGGEAGTATASTSQTYVSLVGEVPANNVAVTSMTLTGLDTNTVYTFRYRVLNKHGWGGYSATVAVLTATVPAAMAAPSFTIDSATPTSVTLEWAAPYNGGNAIASYSILIQHGDGSGSFSTELTYCDGASLATITSRRCTIPFTTFRAAPFGLALNSLIVAKIAATNVVGQGTYSTVNAAGITIQTEPGSPTLAPTADLFDEASATVGISWLTGLGAGNSDILYYELSWDGGLA